MPGDQRGATTKQFTVIEQLAEHPERPGVVNEKLGRFSGTIAFIDTFSLGRV